MATLRSPLPSKTAHRLRRTLKLFLLLTLGVTVLAAALLGWKWRYLRLGAEGYVFGYPLVIMDITRSKAAATVSPTNTLHHLRAFPQPDFKEVVRPNVDTLYSVAFMDLSAGPLVFEMPRNTERYDVMPLMDAWTNVFASLGTRTTGTQGGRYLIAGPDWQGPTPQGLSLLKSPTAMVWLIGRTQTRGAADYPVVHRLQDGLQLRPWAAPTAQAGISAGPSAGASRPAPSTPVPSAAPPGTSQPSTVTPAPQALLLPPVVQMRQLSARDFYNRLTHLMVSHPPAAADAPLLRKLATIGVAPGHVVQWSGLEHAAVSVGRWWVDFKIEQEMKKPRAVVNGWSTPPRHLGQYGTDYNLRALVARVGLGANLPDDAMYPSAQVDSTGTTLDGRHAYRLHFAAGEWPPVKAFWSVTAYGPDDFLIDNPEHRYALGSLSPLVHNADGSLDLWLQAQPPADAQRSNWLPTPHEGRFLLNARLYWPLPEALDGRWHMPAIERLR